MTFRLSMIAAVLLLSSATAFAGDVSTDAARARASQATRASRVAPAAIAEGVPATTDQARALAAGGNRMGERSGQHEGSTAVASTCTCKHG